MHKALAKINRNGFISALLLSVTFCPAALSQACHCSEDRARELKAAKKVISANRNKKPLDIRDFPIHATPRTDGAGSLHLNAAAEQSTNNSK